MIDYDKYVFHIEVFGSKEEFIEHIQQWKEAAPWMTEEEMIVQLDIEQEKRLMPLSWLRPWMG